MTIASTTCMATPTLTQHIVDNVDNKGLTLARTISIRRVGTRMQAGLRFLDSRCLKQIIT
jgi:hypothetical protein